MMAAVAAAAGRLTTHVLDTARGCPAAGVALVLARVQPGPRQVLVEACTNHDGRCDAPLLEGAALQQGVYELDFAVGAYFKAHGAALPQPPFLDTVTLRFGIADPAAHYHVPLLVSPYGYSTYRGS